MGVAKLILAAPPLESPMLPLLTAAVADGKFCGADIPTIGIKSEPNKAANRTRDVIEAKLKEARIVTIRNSPDPSLQNWNIVTILGEYSIYEWRGDTWNLSKELDRKSVV